MVERVPTQDGSPEVLKTEEMRNGIEAIMREGGQVFAFAFAFMPHNQPEIMVAGMADAPDYLVEALSDFIQRQLNRPGDGLPVADESAEQAAAILRKVAKL